MTPQAISALSRAQPKTQPEFGDVVNRTLGSVFSAGLVSEMQEFCLARLVLYRTQCTTASEWRDHQHQDGSTHKGAVPASRPCGHPYWSFEFGWDGAGLALTMHTLLTKISGAQTVLYTWVSVLLHVKKDHQISLMKSMLGVLRRVFEVRYAVSVLVSTLNEDPSLAELGSFLR